MPWDSVFEGEAIAGADPAEVAARRAARQHRRGRRDRTKRRDIQGLRMVAVVAVVFNHLTGHPSGGFVGVDVFFVISGFLITGHLLREHEKRKTISLLDFYKRRIRRLFPAALTVTLATVIVADIVFTQARFKITVTDAVWATLFSANWRFINTGTDYFQAAGPVSALQHYWSLSVEEQFYLAWPLVILIALLLAGRVFAPRSGARSTAAFVAGALLTGGSLVVAAVQSSSDPVVAYFSTFDRGWELGLGALLAVLSQTKRMQRITSTPLTTTVSWTGLALIVVSLFVVTQHHFPFPGALLPCLGSALVIIGWSRRAPAANFLLTNRLSNYLGDISYSIYVVHFPVIIFADALLTTSSATGDTAVLLLILSVSMLLFHVIEDPIRRGNWLKPRRERGQYVTSARLSGQALLVGLASGVCALAVFVLIPPQSAQYNDVLAALQAQPAATSTTPPPPDVTVVQDTDGPSVSAHAGRLRSALLAKSWPSLSPAMGGDVPSANRQCGLTFKPASQCTWGNASAKKVIYLVGDSTSDAYTQAFVSLLHYLPDWRLRAAGGAGCPFADRVLKDGPRMPGCGGRNAKVLAEIKAVRPDVVVSTSGVGNLSSVNSASILAQLEKIETSVRTIVLLPPEPTGPDPNSCYTKFSKPADCLASVNPAYQQWLERNEAMAEDVHGAFIDPTSWYCLAGYCPAFVGTVPVRKDTIHLTHAYAKTLGPLVYESLQKARLVK